MEFPINFHTLCNGTSEKQKNIYIPHAGIYLHILETISLTIARISSPRYVSDCLYNNYKMLQVSLTISTSWAWRNILHALAH